jgi:hypothetical protein
MNKRILLVTGYGKQSLDAYYSAGDLTIKEIADMTLPSKLRYVNKHGYDLLSIQDFGEDKEKNFEESNMGFLRVSRTADMLKYYDIVLWVDADSIITNDEIKIENFPLEENIAFYASYDWNGRYSISAGNFLFVKNHNTDNFLNVLYSLNGKAPNEQVAMNYLYFNTPLKNMMKILDHDYLNAAPSKEMYAEQWATRADIPYHWNKNSFLCHLTGASNIHRKRILNTYFKNYL